MMKKISAIILALVLCLSVMVVPAAAAVELGDAQIAIALEWDKEYYNPGDEAVLSIYVDAADDLSLFTGAITIGFNSAVINMADNPIATVKANATTSDTFASYYKTADGNTSWFTTATLLSKLQEMNTAEENEKFDTYLKFLIAKNTTGGWHENTGVNNAGFNGSDFDPTEPIVTYTLKISESAPNGTPVEAKVTTGSYSVANAAQCQTSWKYYKTPGSAQTTANITADGFSSTAATAVIGVAPCEEHTWNEGVETTAPTCADAGEMTYTCTVCNSTKTEAIAATGLHTAGEAVEENEVPASCNVAGSKDVVVYCSVCEAEMSRTATEIPATGEHNYATEVERVEPTCTVDGYYVMACGCGTRDEAVVIPAAGHDYDAVVTAPTCTEAGYTTYTCACGDVVVADEVAAAGHDYDAVVTAPTCTEAGYTTYTCACGDVVVADEVAAAGHDYEVTFVKNATCSKDGYTQYTCSACGDTYKETIPSKNHTYEDGSSALVEIPAVAPTCKNQGYTAGSKCELCNTNVVAPQGVPATGHTKENGVVTEPTYFDGGYTTYVCPVCDVEFKDDYTDKLVIAFTFKLAEPSVTVLRARDTIILHPEFTGDVADGVTVVWTADNENFEIVEVYEDGSIKVEAKKVVKGTDGLTTFTATVVDADGNEITSDTVELTANAKFFQRLVGFFRVLFKKTANYEK